MPRRHFTNTLIVAVLASAVFMVWSLSQQVLNTCLRDWKEKWVNVAFWSVDGIEHSMLKLVVHNANQLSHSYCRHVFFSAILVVIMFLWRPTNTNQRYAFTPLLDEDEDDDDEGACPRPPSLDSCRGHALHGRGVRDRHR